MTRLRARVRSVTERTKHWLTQQTAVGIQTTRIPDPISVELVEDGGAFFLFRLDEDGVCIADSCHPTVEEAKDQARFEYCIEEDDWTESADRP